MRSRNILPAIFFLFLTILLAACGDATATTGPATQPTTNPPTKQPTATPYITDIVITTGATTRPPTKAATTAATTTAPATTAATMPTKPATTAAPGATPGAKGLINLGQPFDLKEGQTATLAENGMTLRFGEISEDSRCPEANPGTGKAVECFWSGQVTAVIEVNEGVRSGQMVKLTLPGSVNTKTTSKVMVGSYQLEVKQILPKKYLDVDIQPGDYAVTLVLTK